ncbi:MAG TPA: hypothetical protein VEB59_03010 [Gemmatimonadales bacterium]|nr:hypothetical protein [Gemmatimonadales bacterium]
MLPRQARVRPSFSESYSRITPGEWHHAAWVRERALADLRTGALQWQEEEGRRVLPDAHFEFQGGRNADKGVRGVERRMLRPRE